MGQMVQKICNQNSIKLLIGDTHCFEHTSISHWPRAKAGNNLMERKNSHLALEEESRKKVVPTNQED